MQRAVDLRDDEPTVAPSPRRIEVATATTGDSTNTLLDGPRQPEPVAQQHEVDLAEGVGALGNIGERREQQRAVPGPDRARHSDAQIRGADDSLLHRRGKQAAAGPRSPER